MKYKILLVDDDRALLKMLSNFLELKGYEVNTASGGMEAMESIKAVPDLILLDINMPGMDGLKATRILREYARFDNLPIIAMTAHAMNGDREKSLSVGMQDYIAKPIEPSVLLSTLARWIHRDGRSPRR